MVAGHTVLVGRSLCPRSAAARASEGFPSSERHCTTCARWAAVRTSAGAEASADHSAVHTAPPQQQASAMRARQRTHTRDVDMGRSVHLSCCALSTDRSVHRRTVAASERALSTPRDRCTHCSLRWSAPRQWDCAPTASLPLCWLLSWGPTRLLRVNRKWAEEATGSDAHHRRWPRSTNQHSQHVTTARTTNSRSFTSQHAAFTFSGALACGLDAPRL